MALHLLLIAAAFQAASGQALAPSTADIARPQYAIIRTPNPSNVDKAQQVIERTLLGNGWRHATSGESIHHPIFNKLVSYNADGTRPCFVQYHFWLSRMDSGRCYIQCAGLLVIGVKPPTIYEIHPYGTQQLREHKTASRSAELAWLRAGGTKTGMPLIQETEMTFHDN